VVAAGTPDQLKTALGGDTIRAGLARPVDAGRARATIEAIAGVGTVAIEGAALHARVTNGAAVLPAALAALDAAGVELASISVARPSLDDVYLHHAGRSFGEADRLGHDREAVLL
jgi:ABC-2 type transport system ATP-binding protein